MQLTVAPTDTRIAFPDGRGFRVLVEALQGFVDEPNRLFMGTYRTNLDDIQDPGVLETMMGHPFPECGTVLCLAGAASLIADPGEKWPNAVTGLHACGLSTAGDGNGFDDPAARELWYVFHLTHLKTYAALREALLDRFTFPGPLPEPATA